MTLNLSRGRDQRIIQSTFQVSFLVHKLLMSVGRICDCGFKVLFDSKGATMFTDDTNQKASSFERRNGLYVSMFEASLTEVQPKAFFSRQG